MLAVLAAVFRDVRRGALVASALVVAFFGFGHVAALVADLRVAEWAQLAAWGLVVIAVTVVAVRVKDVRRVTSGLNVVAIVLIVFAAVSIVPYEVSRAARPSTSGESTVTAGATIGPTRDIYYLVFDRYGSADAIERRFGITDNDLPGWLADRGFQVPADSRAAYRATDFSLASTLNMEYLDRLTTEVGRDSGDRTPAQALLGEHEVGRFLRDRGYRYYHVGSWFDPTASNPMADTSLSLATTSEFESVLRDTTVVPAIERLLGEEEAGLTFRERHREGALFQLRQVRRLASAPGPKFVFAHILLPHDPYVFRADGSFVSEEEASATDEGELYAGQLEYANRRIKEIVADLLAGPDDSDPIVIVAADEGPLMCRSTDCPSMTPEYYAVRFGILNALYLPGIETPLPSTFTAVNTFRVVLREYFGADLELLPDHSYTWPDNDHIYDFREVTSHLRSGAGGSP